MKLLIFSLLVCSSSAGFFNENPCGPIMSNFDVSKLKGFWYEVMRTPNEYEEGFECETFKISPTNNRTFEFHESIVQNRVDFTAYQHGTEAIFTAVEKENSE